MSRGVATFGYLGRKSVSFVSFSYFANCRRKCFILHLLANNCIIDFTQN